MLHSRGTRLFLLPFYLFRKALLAYRNGISPIVLLIDCEVIARAIADDYSHPKISRVSGAIAAQENEYLLGSGLFQTYDELEKHILGFREDGQ